MNKTKLKKLRAYYEDMRNQIQHSLDIATKNSELDVSGDEVDKIQGNTLHQINEKLLLRSSNNLTLLTNAIRIIDEDGLAINECEDCGEAIGEKRLMLLFGVRNCVHCAEESENNSKMFA